MEGLGDFSPPSPLPPYFLMKILKLRKNFFSLFPARTLVTPPPPPPPTFKSSSAVPGELTDLIDLFISHARGQMRMRNDKNRSTNAITSHQFVSSTLIAILNMFNVDMSVWSWRQTVHKDGSWGKTLSQHHSSSKNFDFSQKIKFLENIGQKPWKLNIISQLQAVYGYVRLLVGGQTRVRI